MARLPRPLWRNVLPDLTGTPYYPTMSWLAVDGYGFDRAYFDTEKVVTKQWRPAPYPWLGRADYFPRAVDQGIGRALWFIHGARPNLAQGSAITDVARQDLADRHDLPAYAAWRERIAAGLVRAGTPSRERDLPR